MVNIIICILNIIIFIVIKINIILILRIIIKIIIFRIQIIIFIILIVVLNLSVKSFDSNIFLNFFNDNKTIVRIIIDIIFVFHFAYLQGV